MEGPTINKLAFLYMYNTSIHVHIQSIVQRYLNLNYTTK